MPAGGVTIQHRTRGARRVHARRRTFFHSVLHIDIIWSARSAFMCTTRRTSSCIHVASTYSHNSFRAMGTLSTTSSRIPCSTLSQQSDEKRPWAALTAQGMKPSHHWPLCARFRLSTQSSLSFLSCAHSLPRVAAAAAASTVSTWANCNNGSMHPFGTSGAAAQIISSCVTSTRAWVRSVVRCLG